MPVYPLPQIQPLFLFQGISFTVIFLSFEVAEITIPHSLILQSAIPKSADSSRCHSAFVTPGGLPGIPQHQCLYATLRLRQDCVLEVSFRVSENKGLTDSLTVLHCYISLVLIFKLEGFWVMNNSRKGLKQNPTSPAAPVSPEALQSTSQDLQDF